MSCHARLSNSLLGEWELYIVIDGTDSKDWPVHDFRRTVPVPTLGERAEALTALGFEPTDGAGWEWRELSYTFTERAYLTATLAVRRIGGAA